MSLSDIVNIVVSLNAPAITLPGFGIILIATPTPTWPERTRTYDDITDVSGDFAAGTAEYTAAQAAFGQSPTVQQIMFGRMANKPTKIQIVSLAMVADGLAYSVRVWQGGVLQTATYTAGGSDTNDQIVAGLVAAVNALAAPALNFTASASGSTGSHSMTCTSNAAGNYFSVELMDLNLMSIVDTTADPGIVADLTAISAESNVWYGLGLLFKSNAIVLAAAGYTETATKLFIVASSDSACATHAVSGASDVLANLVAADRASAGASYHPRDYEFFDVAQMGRWFPITPGGDNWRMKKLSGVTPGIGIGFAALTETMQTNIKAKFGNFFYAIAQGTNVVGGNGLVAANEYIDVVRGIAWWSAQVQQGIVNLEIELEKIPFTDDGVVMIKNIIKSVNKQGVTNGLINPTPAPTVTAPLVADIDPTDKQNRNLPDVAVQWTLAGAINSLKPVNATITE